VQSIQFQCVRFGWRSFYRLKAFFRTQDSTAPWVVFLRLWKLCVFSALQGLRFRERACCFVSVGCDGSQVRFYLPRKVIDGLILVAWGKARDLESDRGYRVANGRRMRGFWGGIGI